MGDTEEYFPRGGKKPTVTYFKQSSNFLEAAEKGERKKKRPKKKSEGDDGYLSDEASKEISQSVKNCAHSLNYKTIKPGVLILGRVKKIQETKVIIMLPCRMIGNVMACHISEPYNKVLEAYVNDQTEKVRELHEMFRPGQYVAVKVLEVENENIMLSMMPQHLNEGKKHSELHKGTLLQAAVSSVEDHGYVMDIGLSNTRAFMPKAEANPDVELDIGVLTWCCVKSITPSTESSVVTLTSLLESLQRASLRRKPDSAILPGSAVLFTVDTPLENGIEGHIFADTTAYIQRQHADQVKGKKPALGQKITARILYVMPTRNTPFLTMRNIFESTHPDLAEEQKLKDGDVIEEAQVLKITGRSIHFKLRNGCVGTMSLRRIQVHEELSDEDIIAKSYPIGSIHKVRVLCYNLSDYLYSVSDQSEVVNERYFSMEQLEVGEIVDATVKSVDDKHVVLNVGRISGLVPRSHVTDAGTYVEAKLKKSSKSPTKKFKVGQPLRARVLALDLVKQTLLLTLKPSLMAPDLEVLQSYEQAQVGKAYTGSIKFVRDYILVSFFNYVVAFVPRHYITKEPLESLADAYHVGQIVNCTILSVNPEAKKMCGSLRTKPFVPDIVKEKSQKRKQNSEDNDTAFKKQKTDKETNNIDKNRKKKANKNQNENTDIEQIETDKGSDIETKDKKAKKKKRKDSQQEDSDSENTKGKEDGNIAESKRSNKKRKNIEEAFVEDRSIENTKKNRDSNKKEKDSELFLEENDDTHVDKNKDKKKRKHSEGDSEDNGDTHLNKGERDDDREESDPIDTDVADDGEILTPQDLGLIDLSECTTGKQYKKKVVALLKSINAKTNRMDKIDKKIIKIEEKGLHAKNKKFHTAMHMEKLVIEERLKKILEVLKIAQEKLKELGVETNKDYKKKKEKIKKQNTSEGDENSDVINQNINNEEIKKKKKDKIKEEKEMIKEAKKEKLKVERKDVVSDIKVVESLEPALEVPSAKEFWSVTTESLAKNVAEDESSSSEEEEKDQPKKKRKKLSVAEKLAKVREEEERIREMERRAVESTSQPRSTEQFERALLANPDCSQLWIAYIAFHLQATEIDKARAVGRKALTTISFREEDEKLNVWLAMINLENRFGTKESQQKTLEEALQMNDKFKIHSKLLDIYVETCKQQELSSLVDLMLRKYKRDTNMYIMCGNACFKLGLVDKARHVMQKAIAVLEKKEHVGVLVQFALLERNHGAKERAEALFEQVLAVYPQRVDVCSVYVDMLVKSGDIEPVRQVMERMTSLKLPARKMKVLFKKWIEVEEKLGDKELVEKIRQRAIEYVEKAKF
ncbi:hypothetical protein K1T71_010602 [Dendrolimus kikuchii]|uniref:Uncharacterized protein n=1 Tax=Dendrolimus kikuchii TaxID=765133 RepID=A0ACC1CPD8_9NEOP|nr:hypothetical protein K1T71_010602 [Dendrolimus kikuchii]